MTIEINTTVIPFELPDRFAGERDFTRNCLTSVLKTPKDGTVLENTLQSLLDGRAWWLPIDSYAPTPDDLVNRQAWFERTMSNMLTTFMALRYRRVYVGDFKASLFDTDGNLLDTVQLTHLPTFTDGQIDGHTNSVMYDITSDVAVVANKLQTVLSRNSTAVTYPMNIDTWVSKAKSNAMAAVMGLSDAEVVQLLSNSSLDMKYASYLILTYIDHVASITRGQSITEESCPVHPRVNVRTTVLSLFRRTLPNDPAANELGSMYAQLVGVIGVSFERDRKAMLVNIDRSPVLASSRIAHKLATTPIEDHPELMSELRGYFSDAWG